MYRISLNVRRLLLNQVAYAYVNKLKMVLSGTILLKFVGKRDEILSICKKDVIGCC